MAGITGESIPCSECGELFVFSSAERAFYDSKGLLPPKRCKTCRAARKSQERVNAPAGAPPRGASASTDRPSWEATCSGCGSAASVPFEPQAGRDVFCSRCWRARREPPGVGRRLLVRGGEGEGAGDRLRASERVRDVLDAADTDAEREVGMPAIIE